tara:strand:+ start:1283 stop:1633 length:351 start_codon:yes stop_codon:yes gene_type:complete
MNFARIVALTTLLCQTALGAVYSVGPKQELREVHQVRWESLNPDDVVRMHWREAPYRANWVICRCGTRKRPIIICGVHGAGGKLPVINGENAVTRRQLSFSGEGRSVIKIGSANIP